MDADAYLDALLGLPRLWGFGASPDGEWVAWTWYGVGPAADVYVAPADASAEPVRLTDSGENSHFVSWAPDSRSVLVGQDHAGDERVQLLRVYLERPGEMEPLTELSPEYFLRGGKLHPNGRWLIYGMNYDVTAGQEIEPTWTYRHDLETGERKVLARPKKASFFAPEPNEQGTHILYHRHELDPSGWQAWLVDIEGQDDREILNFGAANKVTASWCPDGRRVIFVAEEGSSRRIGVWEMDGEEITWLPVDPARNIEFAFVPRGSDRVVLAEIVEARIRASLFDLETGEERQMPDTPGDLLPRRPLPDGTWIGRYTRSTQPADLVRFDLSDLRPEAFTSVTRVWDRTPIRPADFCPAEDFRWRSDDGLEIQGWLYRTRRETRGTIVKIHGGPTGHSEDELDAEIQFFVSRGFNVLDPNYRGSTGFSLGFREAIKEDGWGGREQDDIGAGIVCLIAAGIAEPGKVGVTGTSYGGYSSWCAITRFPPELVAASAPICGMTDLVVDYETTRPDLRPYSEEMMGGTPEQQPARYHDHSPIHYVDRIRGRLLIVQGMRDPNVSPENVAVVREALDRAGVEYEVLAFEDEGHGIRQPKNQRVLYQRLAQFFTEAFAT